MFIFHPFLFVSSHISIILSIVLPLWSMNILSIYILNKLGYDLGIFSMDLYIYSVLITIKCSRFLKSLSIYIFIFEINNYVCHRHIKSNLHPIVFPKELYQ